MISPLALAAPALLGIVSLAIVTPSFAVAQSSPPVRPAAFPPDRPIFIERDTCNRLQSFALVLLKQCTSGQPGNIAISPPAAASACIRLDLKPTGRRPAPLDFKRSPTDNPNRIPDTIRYTSLLDYTCTDRLFVDENFKLKDSFRNILAKDRQPEGIITRIPFNTDSEKDLALINRTISLETKGNIPEALPKKALPTQASFMAVTAATINSAWHHPFPARQTKKAAFHLENGRIRQTPFMHAQAVFPCILSPEYTAIELPYASGPRPDASRIGIPMPSQTGSMIIIMPDENTPLDAFVQSLTVDKLAAIRRELLNSKRQNGGIPVALSLPKFNVETRIDLTPALGATGLTDQLAPRSTFTNIFAGKPPTRISGIWQTCILTVSERGTGTSETSLPEKTEPDAPPGNLPDAVPVEINRPFLWYIVPNEYHSRSPAVFIGIVREP